MNNQVKSIQNYINNEFKNVEPIDYFDMAPKSFHSFYGGYKAEYHIEQGDYTQEAYDLFMSSELNQMCCDFYSDYNMEMEDAIRNNPEEYGYEEEDIDEDFYFDEDGLEYVVFTNYFISLVQEAINNIEIQERTELLESMGFDILDNSTIEVDAEYRKDNYTVRVSIYEDYDFSLTAMDTNYEDIDFDGTYIDGRYTLHQYAKDHSAAPNRYSKEAFTTYLQKAMQVIEEEAAKVEEFA